MNQQQQPSSRPIIAVRKSKSRLMPRATRRSATFFPTRKAITSAAFGAVPAMVLLAAASAPAANTVISIKTAATTDISLAGNYSGSALPATTNDVELLNSIYTPTAFVYTNNQTLNLSMGTFDDLNTSQAFTITNGTSGKTSTFTLNGGVNSAGGSVAAGDILYVASGGTLTIGGGTGTLNVALAASGNFDIAGTATINSIISGAFNVTKTGAGTLTLNGANTYSGSGGTTVSVGTLQIGNGATATSVIAGAASVSSGATLSYQLAPGAASVSTIANTISGAGNLTVTSTGGVTLSSTATMSGTGTTSITGSTTSTSLSGVSLAAGQSFQGATTTISGSSEDSTYTTGAGLFFAAGSLTTKGTANFSGTILSGATGAFGGGIEFSYGSANATTLTVNGGTTTFTGTANSGPSTVEGILLNNFSASVASGASLILDGETSVGRAGIELDGGGNASSITLSGLGTVTLESTAANLVLVGSIINNSAGLTLSNATASIASGLISGSGSLTKAGSGTLTLSHANTYTGGTMVSAGTLANGIASAIPTGYLVTVEGTGTYNLAGFSDSISGLSDGGVSTGIVTSSSGTPTLTLTNSSTSTFSGAIGGSLALTLNGSGTQVLAGANTYSGITTVSAGTLEFTATTAMSASSAVSVSSGGTLAVQVGSSGTLFTNGTSGNGTIGGLLSGLGGQSGSTVSFASGSALGIDTTNAGGSFSYAGSITTSGLGITKLGTGTLTLSAANTYTGPTTTLAGTLNLSNQLAVQNSTLTMAGGTVVFDQSVVGNAFTLGGLAATTNGAGYDIALQNNAGTPAAVALTVGGNNASTAYAGVLSGAGSLIKTGSGVLTPSGANTFSGGLTILSGTVNIGSTGVASSFGSGTITLGASGDANSVTISSSNNSLTFTNPITVASGYTGIATISPYFTCAGLITLNSNNIEFHAGNNGIADTGGVSGTGNINLQPITTGVITLGPGGTLNNIGSINTIGVTNTGITGGTVIISAAVGANVTQISNGQTAAGSGVPSPLTVSGAITVGASNKMFSSTSTSLFTISGGVTGNGSLTFEANNTGGITAQTVTLNNAGSITNSGTGTGTTTISAAIGASVTGVTQSSTTSTLTLSGTNTYTAGTMVSGGTLDLANQLAAQSSTVTMSGGILAFDQSVAGNAFTLGGLAATTSGAGYDVALQNNAATPAAIALTVGGNNANTTYAGVLSGAGSLIKSGTGTLTLTGTNTYAGTTTINAGILALGAATNTLASTGTVNFGGSGTLNIGSGSQTLKYLTVGNGSFTDSITGSGGMLTVTGTANPLYIADGSDGTTYTSTLTLSNVTIGFPTGSTIDVANQTGSNNSTSTGTLTLNSGATLNTAGSITIAYMDYTGGANSASAGGTITINNGGTLAANSITMQTANHQNGLHSALITLNPGGLLELGTLSAGSSVSTTYTNTITFNGGTIENYPSTNLLINALIGTTHTFTLGTSGTPTFDITTGNTGTIDEPMVGSGSLTMTDAGTLILNAVNTYTGDTNITGGTLAISSAGQLGSAGSYAGAVSISSGATFQYDSTAAQTISGLVSGAGTVIVTNTGALSLSNVSLTNSSANVFVGNVPGVSSTLNLSGTAAFSPTIYVGDSTGGSSGSTATGTLTQSSGTVTAGTVILGYSDYTGGSNAPSSSGTLTLSGGTLNVSTLILADSTNNTPSGHCDGVLNINSGAIIDAQTIEAGQSVTAGGYSGPGSFTRTINWNNGTIGNYNSSTSLSIGPTTLGSDVLTITLSSGGSQTFSISSGQTGTLSSTAILGGTAGASGLTLSGGGTLTFDGVNTYAGNTNITAGTLDISSAGQLGSGSYAGNVSISSSATFQYDSSVAQTISGLVSGAGTVIVTNTGALSLSNVSLTNSGVNVFVGNVPGVSSTLNLSGTVAFSPTIYVGDSTSSSGSTATGTLTQASGTVTAGKVILGYSDYTGGSNAPLSSGTLTLSGGTLNVSTLILADSTNNTPNGHCDGVLNINSGAIINAQTIEAGQAVTAGGYSGPGHFIRTINWNNGTIGNYNSSTSLSIGPTTLSSGAITITLSPSGSQTFSASSGQTITQNSTAAIGGTAGASGLTIGGLGTVVFNANNTYAGGTTLSGGTLLAMTTTSSTGAGPVAVSGGRLGGTGTIANTSTNNGLNANAVSINSTGTISPGADAAETQVGTLTTGDMTWNGGAYLFKTTVPTSVPINTAGDAYATLNGGTSQDFVVVNGSLDIVTGSPFTVAIDGLGTTPAPGATFTVAFAQSIYTEPSVGGALTPVATGPYSSADFVVTDNGNGGYAYNVSIVSDTGNGGGYDVQVTVAPEPGSLGLLSVAALGLLRRRRRGC